MHQAWIKGPTYALVSVFCLLYMILLLLQALSFYLVEHLHKALYEGLLKCFALKTVCSKTKQFRSFIYKNLIQRLKWVERWGFSRMSDIISINFWWKHSIRCFPWNYTSKQKTLEPSCCKKHKNVQTKKLFWEIEDVRRFWMLPNWS